MNRLFGLLQQNGIIEAESDIEKNIKQSINPHIIELITKTLQYSQVMLDIFHKYVVNIYYAVRTFDVLTEVQK
jgi:hypothetical protein